MKRRIKANSRRPESGACTVLIVGTGGGSLGLEIFKSLRYAGGYRLIGTDLSEKAFGLYLDGFAKTYLVRRSEEIEYVQQLLKISKKENARVLAPGAEEVQTIVSRNRKLFEQEGLLLMVNSDEVCSLCADKVKQMQFLEARKIPVPVTREVRSEQEIKNFEKFPCVVKPAACSGGSNLVFIAENRDEAVFFVRYLVDRGFRAALQEYIPSCSEFTVGVLSDPSGEIIGSIALKRFHDQKLSVISRYSDRVISSGWSQGEIRDFREIRRQAERIARALGSTWALNIQGRLGAGGIFYPFEVNPRHSGTTYFRALAGFNEPHILIQRCLFNRSVRPEPLKCGIYLRALSEQQVPAKEVRTLA